MLHYSNRGKRHPLGSLTEDEDRMLRLGFGRTPAVQHITLQDRKAAESIVRQHYDYKHWFLCDCRPETQRPPTLFLVHGDHLARESLTHAEVTPHAASCVFALLDTERQALEQIQYRPRPPHARHFDLLHNYHKENKPPARSLSMVTEKQYRPLLATLLCELLHAAGLDQLAPSERLQSGMSQRLQENEQLMIAARSFTLTGGRSLADWLALGARNLYALKRRIAATKGVPRPYGVFIDAFGRIEDEKLYLKDKPDPFATISGSFKIFGENKAKIRPPYLVIGIVSYPHQEATEIEIINAYAHPCVAWDRFMLVDSKLERETLEILVSFRDQLCKGQNTTFAIEKPIFDLDTVGEDGEPTLCRPDFILRPCGTEKRYPPLVIETMGYDTPEYRQRKKEMRPLFECIKPATALKAATVIEHDRFLPGLSKSAADAFFCRKLSAALIGYIAHVAARSFGARAIIPPPRE